MVRGPIKEGEAVKQLERVELAMRDGKFRTLREIAAISGDPEASVSARIRELRSMGFNVHRDVPVGTTRPARYRIASVHEVSA